EQPMKAESGIAVAPTDLSILHRGSLTEHGFGLHELSSGHVNHRRLKMGKREIVVKRQCIRRGSQALVSPRRMAEPEEVSPVGRLKRDRSAGRLHGLLRVP